jgi:hypothetical protein
MDGFSCSIDFPSSLNPTLKDDALSSRQLGVLRVKVSITVRGFMHREVRPLYGGRYSAPELTLNDKAISDDELLDVHVFLPRHEDMAVNTPLLQERLLADLADVVPMFAGKIRVTIGPHAAIVH